MSVAPATFLDVTGPPLAATDCRWCGTALEGGARAAVCGACGAGYHARCWNGHGGCRTPGCAHEPLPRIVPHVPRRPCVHCGRRLAPGALACRSCGRAQTPGGRHRGRRPFARHALAALLLGVLAWVPVLGVFFGVASFFQAGGAFDAIRRDPGLRGTWLALAGVVLAIPALCLQVLLLLFLFLFAS